MTTETQTVVIVDDEPSVRASIKRLLRASGFQVNAYGNALSFARHGRPANPCCLILDVEMPEVDGLQFKEDLERAGFRIPTIFLTGIGDIPMGVHAIKGGAIDFLTKPFDADQLLDAVNRALDQDARSLAAERKMAELRLRFDKLTAREQEVFFAVASGLANKQAALKLGVCERTIKAHRGQVTEKLRADSVAALVRMADLLQHDQFDIADPVPCDSVQS